MWPSALPAVTTVLQKQRVWLDFNYSPVCSACLKSCLSNKNRCPVCNGAVELSTCRANLALDHITELAREAASREKKKYVEKLFESKADPKMHQEAHAELTPLQLVYGSVSAGDIFQQTANCLLAIFLV